MPIRPTLGPRFEIEYTAFLRRRFLWYTALSFPLLAFAAIPETVRLLSGQARVLDASVALLTSVRAIKSLIFGAAFLYVWRRPLGRVGLVRLASVLIIVSGVLTMVIAPFVASNGAAAAGFSEDVQRVMPPLAALLSVFIVHFTASLFLVLSPRQAIAPLVPLLVCFATVTLWLGRAPLDLRLILVMISPLAGLPGVLLSWWRYSRFGERFLGRAMRSELDEMTRELSVARRIQDSFFPQPIRAGRVRFEYAYEPMRAIGGDFVFCHATDDGSVVTIVLGDVTGHGIPAALAVNRLLGELEQATAGSTAPRAGAAQDAGMARAAAEIGEPDASDAGDARRLGTDALAVADTVARDEGPGRLLAALNRYTRATLAREATFATVLAASASTLAPKCWSGRPEHPPGLLRRPGDHRVARRHRDHDRRGRRRRVRPRSMQGRRCAWRTVVLYTDGTFEARNAGEQFGLGRSATSSPGRKAVRPIRTAFCWQPPRPRPAPATDRGIDGVAVDVVGGAPDADGEPCGATANALLGAVQAFRDGPPDDDLLVVEVTLRSRA
ncbi:MAG: SpoIIE family protein phosphatase [Phycisphaerales bacterium]